jgi:hypothetical protein
MDLYDVKAQGFPHPLNYREIDRLFRAGIFDGRQLCKPKGETKWRTIDELFPVLKYEVAAPPLRFGNPARSHKRLPSTSACALIVALLGTAVFHYWIENAPTTGARPEELKQRQAREPAVGRASAGNSITVAARPAPSLAQAEVVADQRRIR